MDEGASKAQTRILITGESKLLDSQEYVFQPVALGNAIEPPTSREVGDWYLGIAERLDGLGADLNIAKQGYMRNVHQADFLYLLVSVFDGYSFVFSPHPKP
jgi:hypothetical protein